MDLELDEIGNMITSKFYKTFDYILECLMGSILAFNSIKPRFYIVLQHIKYVVILFEEKLTMYNCENKLCYQILKKKITWLLSVTLLYIDSNV